MINLIKMDLYKLFKTRVLYIMLAVIVGMTLFYTYIMFYGQQETVTMMDTLSTSMAIFALFIGIFSVIFVSSEYTTGYIKNIGGQIKTRSGLILSKAVALFVFTLIAVLVQFLAQILSCQFCFGYVEFGKAGELFRYEALQFLLHYACGLICMLITVGIRRNMLAMTFAVILGTHMTEFFYEAINSAMEETKKGFDIGKYMLLGNITNMAQVIEKGEEIRVVTVGICFAVIATVISCLIFEKRDMV